MKVGDLVRYRSNTFSDAIGLVTAVVGRSKIMVTVLNNDNLWFVQNKEWARCHWKVISESR